MHARTLAHLSIYTSTFMKESQYPCNSKTALLSHILHPKYPYFEPFYGTSIVISAKYGL